MKLILGTERSRAFHHDMKFCVKMLSQYIEDEKHIPQCTQKKMKKSVFNNSTQMFVQHDNHTQQTHTYFISIEKKTFIHTIEYNEMLLITLMLY